MTCHANYLLKYHCKYVMMTHDCDDLSFGGFIMRSVLRSDRVRTAKIDLTQCQKYAPSCFLASFECEILGGSTETRFPAVSRSVAHFTTLGA